MNDPVVFTLLAESLIIICAALASVAVLIGLRVLHRHR